MVILRKTLALAFNAKWRLDRSKAETIERIPKDAVQSLGNPLI